MHSILFYKQCFIQKSIKQIKDNDLRVLQNTSIKNMKNVTGNKDNSFCSFDQTHLINSTNTSDLDRRS